MLGIFGEIKPPPGVQAYGAGSVFTGLIPFLNNILRLIFVGAGLFALFNLFIAGFGFMTAGGDPKAIEKAWSKIWQSLIGLVIIVISFLLAAIFGYLLFGDTTAILKPKIYGPGFPQQTYEEGMSSCQAGGTPFETCQKNLSTI